MSAIPATMDREHRRNIQMALNEKTQSKLKIDGDFGAKSIAVLKQFQTQCKLACTGIYDESTQQLLEPFIAHKYLMEDDYVKAAAELGVEIAAVKAVVEVEAAGDGFLADGRCDILFERHKFYSALKKKVEPKMLAAIAAANPSICNPVMGGYLGNEREYERIAAAIKIDAEAAIASASWGMFQIMGFNYKSCGYTSVTAFVEDMKQTERMQLKAFVQFIIHNPKLHRALKAKDWKTFAANYNGPRYYEHHYDTRMADAFRLHSPK